MNNSQSHTYIALIICVICAVSFGVYTFHTHVTGFPRRSIEIYDQVQKLEDTQNTIALYRKILTQDSKEQEQINAYIVKGDAVFKAITDIEKDGKRTGLFASGGIVSVEKRESEALKKLQAGEVVVKISVEGDKNNVDLYIQALANLPYVSYIEKVNLQSPLDQVKTRADITLVIIELI